MMPRILLVFFFSVHMREGINVSGVAVLVRRWLGNNLCMFIVALEKITWIFSKKE